MASHSARIAAAVLAVSTACGGNIERSGHDDAGVSGAGSGGSPTGGTSTGGMGGGSGIGGSGIGGSSGTGGTGAGGSSTGGAGGSDPSDRVGRPCATDPECGDGLSCVLASSGAFFGGGPAKGYCTKSCASDPECGVDAVCFGGHCVQRCAFGPQNLSQFDPKKCHGRPEVSCAPVLAGGQTEPACLPTCNSNADCGAGLFCHPKDGLCRSTPPAGAATGEPCQTADECRGACLSVADATGMSITSVCGDVCTYGALPACGWEGPASGVPGTAVCLWGPDSIVNAGGPGIGDWGFCVELCDCNGDCAPETRCTPFDSTQIQSFYQRAGYCSGAEPTGIACT